MESIQHFRAQLLKISLLRAYITDHNFDVICLSEIYLESSILHDNDNLQIPRCNLYREDHPLDIKRGGVCLYYKFFLPRKIKNINYLQECINFEIKIKDKLRNFITLYAHLINVKMILSHLSLALNQIMI